jgi:hypothetical protein
MTTVVALEVDDQHGTQSFAKVAALVDESRDISVKNKWSWL